MQLLLQTCRSIMQPQRDPVFHSQQDFYRINRVRKHNGFDDFRPWNRYENEDVRFDDRRNNPLVFPKRVNRLPNYVRPVMVFRRKPILNPNDFGVHAGQSEDGLRKGPILMRLSELNNLGEPIKVFISPFVPPSDDKLPSFNDIEPERKFNDDPKKKFLKTMPKMMRITQPSPAQYSQLDPTYHVEARASNPLRPLPKPFPGYSTTESPNSLLSQFARGAVERRQSRASTRNSGVFEPSNYIQNEIDLHRPEFLVERVSRVPRTNFSCKNQIGPGYYADMDLGCRVFHICDQQKQKNSFFCPNGTLFNQMVLVCDWEQKVDCSESTQFYNKNIVLYNQGSLSQTI